MGLKDSTIYVNQSVSQSVSRSVFCIFLFHFIVVYFKFGLLDCARTRYNRDFFHVGLETLATITFDSHHPLFF